MHIRARYKQLDALRGLAAMTVLFGHYFAIVHPSRFYSYLSHTPFEIIVAGHQAVMFFFVLSGFVLSLPFLTEVTPGYLNFVVKRICRIYIPYITAIILSITLCVAVSRHGIPELSAWFNGTWNKTVTLSLVLNHLFLTGNQDASLDPVIWSLVQEFRISLVFPLLMFLINKVSWRTAGFLAVALCILPLPVLATHTPPKVVVAGIVSAHYTSMFILGVLMAKHRDYLVQRFVVYRSVTKFAFLLCGVMLYTYPYWFMPGAAFHLSIFDDFLSALGACIFIITAQGSRSLNAILLQQPFQYLGKISYSLYLYHAIVLLTSVYLLYGRVPIPFIWVIALVGSVAISTLSYTYVEAPAIRLARFIVSHRQEGKVLVRNMS